MYVHLLVNSWSDIYIYIYCVCVCMYFCLLRPCSAPLAIFYLCLCRLFKITFPIFVISAKVYFYIAELFISALPFTNFSPFILRRNKEIYFENNVDYKHKCNPHFHKMAFDFPMNNSILISLCLSFCMQLLWKNNGDLRVVNRCEVPIYVHTIKPTRCINLSNLFLE